MSVPTIPDEPNQGLSSNVADMIRMASMCHPSIENGRAHLVWVVIARQRTLSQLAVEWKHGDCSHQKGSSSGPRGHEGRPGAARTHRLVLVWMAASTGKRKKAKTSYIYPAVASFFAHPTGCDPANFAEAQGGRPAGWEKKSASKGTSSGEWQWFAFWPARSCECFIRTFTVPASYVDSGAFLSLFLFRLRR